MATFESRETINVLYGSDRVDQQTAEAKLRNDFEDWSGGFPPESDEQIFIYVDYAMATDFEEPVVFKVLRAWMEQETLS